jgi:hypothetical protein
VSVNSNAQAIGFVQSYVRPVNNALCGVKLGIDKLLAQWSNLSIATVIPNDSNLIGDGNTLNPVLDSQVQTNISDLTAVQTAINNVLARLQALTNGQYTSPV